MKFNWNAALLMTLSLSLSACPSQKTGSAGDSNKGAETAAGTPLVTMSHGSITVEDFKANLMDQSPFVRARYNTPERKAEYLNDMVRFELLAAEAERQGLNKDPEVQKTMKKVMVQKLIRKIGEDGGDGIPEPQLRAFYDAHLSDYVKPERARVSQIFVAAAAGDAKGRAAAEKKIKGLEAQLKKRASETTAFQMIARESSDDAASRATGGDLGYHTSEEFGATWGKGCAEAIFKLETVGNHTSVVEGDKGFHLFKLTGRQKSLERSFDQVRPQIEGLVKREQRTAIFNAFVKKITDEAKVSIDQAALEGIDLAAPAGDAARAGGLVGPGLGKAPGGPGMAPHGAAPQGFVHPKMNPAGAPGQAKAPAAVPGSAGQ